VSDTYPKPPHGWTCFHCGETFKTIGGARDHFGAKPDAIPGCMIRVQYGNERGLQMALRRAEAEVERLTVLAGEVDAVVTQIIRDVCELDPSDYPNGDENRLVCNVADLEVILNRNLEPLPQVWTPAQKRALRRAFDVWKTAGAQEDDPSFPVFREIAEWGTAS